MCIRDSVGDTSALHDDVTGRAALRPAVASERGLALLFARQRRHRRAVLALLQRLDALAQQPFVLIISLLHRLEVLLICSCDLLGLVLRDLLSRVLGALLKRLLQLRADRRAVGRARLLQQPV